jgi:hypothetical protein
VSSIRPLGRLSLSRPIGRHLLFGSAFCEEAWAILPEVRLQASPMPMAKRTGYFPFLDPTSFTGRRFHRLLVNPPFPTSTPPAYAAAYDSYWLHAIP